MVQTTMAKSTHINNKVRTIKAVPYYKKIIILCSNSSSSPCISLNELYYIWELYIKINIVS